MVKYIIKRILISLLILLGVSVIIYTLVRLMPSDYIDNKYSSQLNSGTITQDDIDHFKSLYGLYTPEARFNVSVDGIDGEFSRDIKIHRYEIAVEAAVNSQEEMLSLSCGTYKNGDLRLELEAVKGEEDSGPTMYEYSLYKLWYTQEMGTVTSVNDKGEIITEEKMLNIEHRDVMSKGMFDARYEGGEVKFSFDKVSGQAVKGTVVYRVTPFGEKLGAILGGYFTWLGNLAKGDLGMSFSHMKPVGQVITENMWISFAIAIVATILQFLIAIPLGVSSATHQYSARDYIVTVFTMIGISLPTYFFAAIVIKLFAVDLHILPVNGLISPGASYPDTFAGFLTKFGDIAHHLILPIFVSVALSLGGLMRYTRTNTLEVLNADYIRTARAKGLSEKTVIYKHAFRNTLIPLATLLAGILPGLFGGMMITEQVFGIDGIGKLAYNALRNGDIPFVMGYNMFLAILTVIGTLLSDIMYSIVDPRVKLGR